MKVTDPDVIRTGEKELIDAVKQDLDWDVVKEIIRKRISMRSLKAKDGEIIVHNNKIAFRIDLELNMPVSLMFDREGNYISEKESDAELSGDDSSLVSEEDAVSEDPALVLEEEDAVSENSVLVLDEEDTMSEDFASGAEADGLVTADQMDENLSDTDSADNAEKVENNSFFNAEEDIGELDFSDFEDEDLDENLDDILKESRDFWEHKKEE